MGKPNKMRVLAREYDEPMVVIVLRKLNKHGTIVGAAQELGVGFPALYRWVERHGIRRRIVWEMTEENKS